MDDKDVKARWDEIVARLKQERDELALKLHLGRKEAEAEWERLEAKWNDIRSTKVPPMAEAAKETAGGLEKVLEQAADELKKGYERFRKLI